MQVEIPALLERLKGPALQVAIITHMKPDGDALGSSLGLAHFLLALGHHVTVISPTVFPDNMRWMPGSDQILVAEPDDSAARALMQRVDLLFALDFGKANRIHTLGDVLLSSPVSKVLIDHHLDFDDFAQHVFRDTEASSTCELVYRLVRMLQPEGPLAPLVADCLYTGLYTDTNGFRIPATSPAVHRMAADLLESGVRPHVIQHYLFNQSTPEKLQFLGHALANRLTLRPDLHAAWITVTLEDKRVYHLQPGDTEGLVNLPLQVLGINLSLLLTEEENEIRLSTRSVGKFSANAFCQQFGGGGHYNAAGARLKLPLAQAQERILAALEARREELDYLFEGK
jgi:phosphoesterase RecJ-like protein